MCKVKGKGKDDTRKDLIGELEKGVRPASRSYIFPGLLNNHQ